jgi:hypothetical protein
MKCTDQHMIYPRKDNHTKSAKESAPSISELSTQDSLGNRHMIRSSTYPFSVMRLDTPAYSNQLHLI